MFFSIYTYPQEILKYSIQKSTSPTQESASPPREATSQYLAVIPHSHLPVLCLTASSAPCIPPRLFVRSRKALRN